MHVIALRVRFTPTTRRKKTLRLPVTVQTRSDWVKIQLKILIVVHCLYNHAETQLSRKLLFYPNIIYIKQYIMIYTNISKDGYLFDKEVILQYIITKKNEYSRKLKEYERLKKKEDDELEQKVMEATDKKINNFLNSENNIVSKPIDGFKSEASTSSASISNMENGRNKVLPSYWVPGQLKEAEKPKVEKPDSKIPCPISGKPLKAKDLIPVKFTPVKDASDKKSLIAKENRYMCAITHDILSNSVPCAVLKPT